MVEATTTEEDTTAVAMVATVREAISTSVATPSATTRSAPLGIPPALLMAPRALTARLTTSGASLSNIYHFII